MTDTNPGSRVRRRGIGVGLLAACVAVAVAATVAGPAAAEEVDRGAVGAATVGNRGGTLPAPAAVSQAGKVHAGSRGHGGGPSPPAVRAARAAQVDAANRGQGSTAGSEAGTAACGRSAGGADRRVDRPVAVLVGRNAPRLERFAAAELCRYMAELFGVQAAPGTDAPPGAQAVLLVGRPKTNPAVARAFANGGWPKLSEQGIMLKRLELAGEPALVAGGGSPVATMWAVYELVERWGVRYLVDRDVLPPKRPWPGLPEVDVVMEPNMRIRCWRLVNDLAHGPVSWSLAENRRFLRQMAKMKYNRVHASLWPSQPFVHYTFRGMEKPPGVLYFGMRYPIDADTIGGEKFAGMTEFTNPEFVGAGSAEELRRRAIRLVRGILGEARRLGMQIGLSVQPFEWPKEFMKVLPGSESAHQLGNLTAGPGRTQSLEDPLLGEMIATIVRAYIETYPDIDLLHVGTPEHRGWIGQAEEAYRRLDERYRLSDLGSYEQLCATAQSRTTFPGGGQRVERMLKGDLAALWLFDSLLRDKQLLRRPDGGSDIKIVYNGVVAELFPLVARMVPPGGEVLSFIDYTASRQLRQRELLRQVPPRHVPASLIFTLADDNVGVLPQLATGSLHELLAELRKNGWAGFYTRYWTVGDLDPTVHYLARASWDASVTPAAAYADLVEHVCGPAAVEPALKAFALIEQITLDLDQHGLGFAFPVPGMMTKHYRSGGLSEPIRRDRELYRQALEQMQRALERSRPQGREWLRYFVGRLRFAVRYLDAAEAYGATARAEKAGRAAEARRHIEAARTAIRDALQAYVEVAKDHGDLGAVALMNEYCYRRIRDKGAEVSNPTRKEPR